MKTVQTPDGPIVVLEDDNLQIRDAQTFLEIMYSAGGDTLVIRKENLDPSFFDLKSRLAGEILQKVSNYRVRLIIIGDFSGISSKSLHDFISESNRSGRVVFADTLDHAIALLK